MRYLFVCSKYSHIKRNIEQNYSIKCFNAGLYSVRYKNKAEKQL